MSIRPRRSKSPTITIDRRYAPPERGRWEASKIERGCLRFVRRPLCPYCSSGTFPDTQFSEGWKNSPDSPFFLPTPRQSRAVMEFDRDFSLRQTFVPFALRPYDGFLHAGYCRLMIRCVALRRAAPHCTFPASCPAPLFGEAFFAPRRFSVRIGFVQRAAPPRPGIRRNLRCRLHCVVFFATRYIPLSCRAVSRRSGLRIRSPSPFFFSRQPRAVLEFDHDFSLR